MKTESLQFRVHICNLLGLKISCDNEVKTEIWSTVQKVRSLRVKRYLLHTVKPEIPVFVLDVNCT